MCNDYILNVITTSLVLDSNYINPPERKWERKLERKQAQITLQNTLLMAGQGWVRGSTSVCIHGSDIAVVGHSNLYGRKSWAQWTQVELHVSIYRQLQPYHVGQYKTWTLDWTMDWTLDSIMDSIYPARACAAGVTTEVFRLLDQDPFKILAQAHWRESAQYVP